MDDTFAVEVLARCPLFAHGSRPMLEQLASTLRRRRFRRGEVIMHQGDPGDSLHIVAAGAVKILLPSTEGEEAIIATLRPGDYFGELALLDGAPRSATALTASPAVSGSAKPISSWPGRRSARSPAAPSGLAPDVRTCATMSA